MAEAAPRLETRPLGKTGLRVTPLGLAPWAVRATGGGPPLKLTPEDVERAFHEHGVNTFLVTGYMKTFAEGVRRLIKAGYRDRLVLLAEGALPFGWSVRRAWERDAKALGTDVLDIWLMGWVRKRWYLGGKTWESMLRLREEGKVRAIGWSGHDRKLHTELATELKPDVIMVRYNAAHRGAEKEIFAPLGADRPGVIAYTATRWGMLLQPLKKQGFDRGLDAGECYRFVLGHPSVDMVLCGARSAGEIREDVEAVGRGPLDGARLEEVRRFGDAVHAAARGGWRWMFE